MTGPSLDPDVLEWVVREVIRRLTDHGYTVRSNGAAAGRELVLQERVITRATLEGRLQGTLQVVVGLKAIVTPAVRDDLREQGIQLVRR